MKLEEIKKLIEAATPGPWEIDHPGHGERCEPAHVSLPGEYGRHVVIVDHRRDYSDPAPDARFIAAARTLMPKLLAVAEKASRAVLRDYIPPEAQDPLIDLSKALADLETN